MVSLSFFHVIADWAMESFLIKEIVSSTYLFQQARYSDKVWIKLFSNSTINIPDNTGPNGEPIATPSVSKYVLPLKVKCTPFAHSKIGFFCFLFSNRYVDLVVVVYSFYNNFDGSVNRHIRKKRHNINLNYFTTIRKVLMFDEAHKTFGTIYRALDFT